MQSYRLVIPNGNKKIMLLRAVKLGQNDVTWGASHRNLSNTDCLMVRIAWLVCFISTVNGRSEKKKPIKTGARSMHITNLKQSILETFDIYGAS